MSDQSAWLCELLDRHEGPLIRYAARIVADEDRALDVVQETFLRLLQRGPRPGDGYVPQWLFAVCRNLAIDVCRKERRMSAQEQIAERQPDASPGPQAAAASAESADILAAALAKLPGNQQEVLRLKFHSGFSYKQIAEITGQSVSNVGFLIHRGVRALRARIAGPGA